MRTRPRRTTRWPVAIVALSPLAAWGQAPTVLPDGAGRATVERSCGQCHSLEIVLRTARSRGQWEARIDDMIAKGAKLSDEDIDVIADYLATHFGLPPTQ